MSEVGFFDEAAALKWQIMRMEGVMAASLNNTGSAIMELAARLQELAERQEAAAAAWGSPRRPGWRRWWETTTARMSGPLSAPPRESRS